VGSNLALRLALEELGKTVVSACVDPVPENSLWLKKADTFVDNFCGMGKMSMMTDSTLKMLKKANNICKDILNPDSKDE